MYILHSYNCCDKCLSRSKKLNSLVSRVEQGLKEHFSDFNLEYMIIYIKKRKIQLAKEAEEKRLAGGGEPILALEGSHSHGHGHGDEAKAPIEFEFQQIHSHDHDHEDVEPSPQIGHSHVTPKSNSKAKDPDDRGHSQSHDHDAVPVLISAATLGPVRDEVTPVEVFSEPTPDAPV